MKIEKVDVFDIKIPDVRVTSTWDPEMLDMFKRSIESSGIEQPLYLVKEKDTLWLVDGLHRLEEAKLKGLKTVDCVIRQGKFKDVQMKNLMLNRLRGGTKASEMVSVINNLYRDLNVPIDTIVKDTGLKRDYIDNMLAIGSAHHEVWEALDNEEIGVGHAFQLSRIGDAAVQLRLLHQTRVYKIKIADLKEIVDEAIELIKNQEKEEHNKEMLPAPKPRLATCHFCGDNQDPTKMAAPIMCMSCYGYLQGQIQSAKIEAEKIAAAEAKHKSSFKEEVPASDTPP
jgi:ParB-like chromosome segregation protein Spo0J